MHGEQRWQSGDSIAPWPNLTLISCWMPSVMFWVSCAWMQKKKTRVDFPPSFRPRRLREESVSIHASSKCCSLYLILYLLRGPCVLVVSNQETLVWPGLKLDFVSWFVVGHQVPHAHNESTAPSPPATPSNPSPPVSARITTRHAHIASHAIQHITSLYIARIQLQFTWITQNFEKISCQLGGMERKLCVACGKTVSQIELNKNFHVSDDNKT